MRNVLTSCMVAIVLIMGGTGALSYIAFGEVTHLISVH